MAASETAICNMALTRMGQNRITDIDSSTDQTAIKCALVFDQVRDELLTEGPKEGWKFARLTYHGIDRESSTITSIANSATSGQITVTTSSAHNLVAGDMVTLDDDTGYDDDYDVVSVGSSTTFDVTEDFVATGTGTAYWTSEEYLYRYAIPTSLSVRTVAVSGTELTDWVKQGDYVLTNQESDEVDMTIVQAIPDVTQFPDHFVKVLVLKLAIELHYNLTQDLKAIQLLEYDLEKFMPKAIAMDQAQQYVQESSSSWADIGHTTEIIE